MLYSIHKIVLLFFSKAQDTDATDNGLINRVPFFPKHYLT